MEIEVFKILMPCFLTMPPQDGSLPTTSFFNHRWGEVLLLLLFFMEDDNGMSEGLLQDPLPSCNIILLSHLVSEIQAENLKMSADLERSHQITHQFQNSSSAETAHC